MTSASNFCVEYFRRVKAGGRLGHAYLLGGLSGDPAAAAGFAAARVILCPQDGCGACTVCRAIDAGASPDLHVLRAPADKRIIKVDAVREVILREASMKSHSCDQKVFLLVDAHEMNDAAANCFLKTLEEPPGNSVMLLMSDRSDKLPPTIASRCFRLRLTGSVEGTESLLDAGSVGAIVHRMATEPLETNLEIAESIGALCKGENLDQRRRLALEFLDTIMVHCRHGLEAKGPLAAVDSEILFDQIDRVADAQRWIDSNVNAGLVFDDFVTKFLLIQGAGGPIRSRR